MPIHYRALPHARNFHIVYSGTITTKCVLAFFDRFEADLERHPDFDELCDLTRVTSTVFGSQELELICELVHGLYHRNRSNKKVAFLAPYGPSCEPVRGFVDLVAQCQCGLKALQCYDRDEALNFLSIPPQQKHQLTYH